MDKLSTLRQASVRVLDDDAYPEPGQASVTLLFSDGTTLRMAYWRVLTGDGSRLNSFDHQQKYGLQAPIDAKDKLRKILDGTICIDARLDATTGDLLFMFEQQIRLQVLNITGYEVWHIKFPDGTGEYSNYV